MLEMAVLDAVLHEGIDEAAVVRAKGEIVLRPRLPLLTLDANVDQVLDDHLALADLGLVVPHVPLLLVVVRPERLQ
jgi:hypothetical protein